MNKSQLYLDYQQINVIEPLIKKLSSYLLLYETGVNDDRSLIDKTFFKLTQECVKYIATEYEPDIDSVPDGFTEYIYKLYWEAHNE